MNHYSESDGKIRGIFGEKWLRIAFLLMVWDIVAIHAAYFLALWFRFDCRFSAIMPRYLRQYTQSITIYSACAVAVFWLFRLYRSVWRYASIDELHRGVVASAITSVLYMVATSFLWSMPRSYYLFGGIIQMGLVVGARFSYRLGLSVLSGLHMRDDDKERIMIIGAGAAGQMLLRDLARAKETNSRAVCLIDDDTNKQGRYLEGVPVVGGRDEIMAAAKRFRVDKILLAISSASAEDKRDILSICNETNCKLMQLPGMYQLVLGQVSVSQMKDVSVEDLLGREPIKADLQEVFDYINKKVVLVTGGGSIGSELCRQIAAHNPKQLIIFDVYENNAYSIQLELREKYPDLNLEVLIGSVRDSRRMFQVFDHYHPQIVYHAAAHKHVPLMEDSPCEAIKNNAIGTYKTAYAAMVHGCERFVLISTDKAVNPTNIMGASKRLCEMIIQSFDEKIKAGKANEIPQLFTHVGFENADKDGTDNVPNGNAVRERIKESDLFVFPTHAEGLPRVVLEAMASMTFASWLATSSYSSNSCHRSSFAAYPPSRPMLCSAAATRACALFIPAPFSFASRHMAFTPSAPNSSMSLGNGALFIIIIPLMAPTFPYTVRYSGK